MKLQDILTILDTTSYTALDRASISLWDAGGETQLAYAFFDYDLRTWKDDLPYICKFNPISDYRTWNVVKLSGDNNHYSIEIVPGKKHGR